MKATISAPAELCEMLATFFANEGIALEAVSTDGGDARIEEAPARTMCEPPILYQGGWIRCPDALALAARLSIESKDLGKLLNRLQIKVRECNLGCFR